MPMSDHPGRGLRAVLDAAGAPAAVKAGGHLTRLSPSRLKSSPAGRRPAIIHLGHGHPGGHAGKETNMTSARGVEGSSYRWPMLAVVSLGIVALTLNWFDVATAFPLIGAEFKVGLGSLGLLISLYIVGYGLTHIPGGVPGLWHFRGPQPHIRCIRRGGRRRLTSPQGPDGPSATCSATCQIERARRRRADELPAASAVPSRRPTRASGC